MNILEPPSTTVPSIAATGPMTAISGIGNTTVTMPRLFESSRDPRDGTIAFTPVWASVPSVFPPLSLLDFLFPNGSVLGPTNTVPVPVSAKPRHADNGSLEEADQGGTPEREKVIRVPFEIDPTKEHLGAKILPVAEIHLESIRREEEYTSRMKPDLPGMVDYETGTFEQLQNKHSLHQQDGSNRKKREIEDPSAKKWDGKSYA
ncbi:hypothetical protein QFC19_002470 [Naganishia cerealis]|uniref:Uncharacterized protein n=1 Tax=Naganishia cerealis TaxID=610337 RepID=A0ACC2W9U1_9TREE|nr:hypothetical protein QFC19_002470 [Naganishia cerealis]